MQGARCGDVGRWVRRIGSVAGSIAIAIGVSACDSDPASIDLTGVSEPPSTVVLSGVVEKGAFVELQVLAHQQDASGQPLPVVEARTGPQGQYEVEVQRDAVVRLEARGQFIDELSGQRIQVDEPLMAIQHARISGQQNINLLTHLGAVRAQGQSGRVFPGREHLASAQQEVNRALGFAPSANPAELSFDRIAEGAGPDDPNLRLLLFSAGLMDLPRDGGRLPLEWSGLNGVVMGAPSVDGLAAAFALFNGLDVARIIARLNESPQIELPPLAMADGLQWTCAIVCDFVAFPSDGVHVVGTSAYESSGEVTVIIRRDGDLSAPVDIALQLRSGTATADIDFVAVDRQVTIEAGQSRVLVRVPVLIDAVAEGLETLTAQISAVDASTPILTASASLSITDDAYPGASRPVTASIALESACFVAVGAAAELEPAACLDPVPALQGLVGADPELAMRVGTVLRSDCSMAAGCPQRLREYAVDYALVAHASTGAETGRTALGRYAFPGRDVLTATAVTEPSQLLISLAAPDVAGLVETAAAQNWTLTLDARLSLPPDVDQRQQAAVPGLLRLADTIQFGDRLLPLLPGSVTLDAAGCGADELALTGSMLTDVLGASVDLSEIDPAAPPQGYALSGSVCVELAGASSEQPPMAVVASGQVDATGSLWRVPGAIGVQIPGLPTGAVPGLAVLGSRSTAAPTVLVSEHWPFALSVTGGRLDAQGLQLDFNGLVDPAARSYAATDARVDPAERAENRGLFRAAAAGSLRLSATGLNGSLQMQPGAGRVAYPLGEVDWQGFTLELVDSELTSASAMALDYQFQQSMTCRQAGCAAAAPAAYTVSGTLALGPTGTAVGVVTLNAASEPGFGTGADAAPAYSRPSDLPTGAEATLALPGYRFAAGTGLAAALPGHVETPNSATDHPALHPLGSQAATLGNFAPTGLSVGPEYYVSNQGQPDQGRGQDVSGDPLEIGAVGGRASLGTQLATKYVLRPDGLTGVFNVDPAALAQPVTFSGYDLRFSRFAIRVVNNAVDPYNWVDGAFDLPGDAGLTDLAFENLQIDCAARLGQGRLVRERCDALDDNGNGLVDENCPANLLTWSLPTELFGMRFTGPDGESDAFCDASPQRLALEQSVAPLALDRPLPMTIGWSPDGHIAFQQTRGLGDFLFEAGQDAAGQAPGFGMAVSDASLDCADSQTQDALLICQPLGADRYGWVAGSSTVALPFWEALDADYRLANVIDLGQPGGPAVADGSVLLPPGRLDQINGARTNAQIMAGADERSDDQFQVRYQWGGTGFGFELPAYFQPAVANETGIPSLIGVRRSADLIVLEAGAGINFVEPIRTKFSFGASADIQALTELEFQVNLQDGESLRKVDALLVEAGILDAPVLTPVLDSVSERLNLFNRFAGRGLDYAIEEALVLALERSGAAAANVSPLREDPLVSVSRGLSQLDTLPDQVLGQLRSRVTQPIEQQLAQVEQGIRAPFLSLRQQLEAQPAGTPAGADVADRLDELAARVGGIRDALTATSEPLDDALAEATALLAEANQAVARVQTSLAQLRLGLEQATTVFSEFCGTPGSVAGEAGSYLTELFDNVASVRALLSLVQGSEVLVPLIEIVADDPEVAQALRDGQAGLQNAAESLLTRVATAEMRLQGAVCPGGTTQASRTAEILMDAEGLLDDMLAHTSAIDAALAGIEQQVAGLASLKQRIEAEVTLPFDTVASTLTDVASQLRVATTPPAGTEVLQLLDSLVADAATQLGFPEVNVAIGHPDNLSEIDLLRVASSRLQETLDDRFDQVEQVIRAELDNRLPTASYTPDQLRRMLVQALMDTDPIQQLRMEADAQLRELQYRVNSLVAELTDQVNMTVKASLARVESEVNAALDVATAPLKRIPLQSAGLDGFAIIAGDELERVHIGAEWTMAPSSDGQDANRFGAALDAVSWSASNKTAGCSIPDGQSRLDVTLSAFNLPAAFGPSKITMKKIYMGFTLDQAADSFAPKGVFGGLQTKGDIGFSEFTVYDPAFAAGIGDRETYLGASAGVLFSTINAEAAFLVGRTCNQDILSELDPRVAEFIPIPDTGFAGAYVRGSASIPVYSNGCPLTVGVAADFGAWVLAGPPLTLGGLVGGGAFGKVGCVGALRGQLRAFGTVNTDGDMLFAGEGFAVAGAGLCEPAGWTSRERSREDGFCGTVDAGFLGQYDGSWSLLDLSVDALF